MNSKGIMAILAIISAGSTVFAETKWEVLVRDAKAFQEWLGFSKKSLVTQSQPAQQSVVTRSVQSQEIQKDSIRAYITRTNLKTVAYGLGAIIAAVFAYRVYKVSQEAAKKVSNRNNKNNQKRK